MPQIYIKYLCKAIRVARLTTFWLEKEAFKFDAKVVNMQ